MWQVIQELPGQGPEVVAETAKYEAASALVFQVAESHAAKKGARVYLRKADSADQLQVTRRGVVVREQSELPAWGEDVTVLVPEPARAGAKGLV